jgi:hypothetical protein
MAAGAYICAMGKRTIRIPRSKIESQLAELPGKAAQVVMLDGKTHQGWIKSAEKETIVIADANAEWTSNARHAQKLAVADIHFLILDVISPW